MELMARWNAITRGVLNMTKWSLRMMVEAFKLDVDGTSSKLDAAFKSKTVSLPIFASVVKSYWSLLTLQLVLKVL